MQMTVTEFLQTQVPFLTGLNEEQARILATSAEQLTFKNGQTILFRGVTVEGLHVIAAGKVTVHAKTNPNNKALVQVAELGPGEVFGETSIVEMGIAGATIKAGIDDTLVFVIPQDAFRGVLVEMPELRARCEALIADRKKKTIERSTAAPRPLSSPVAA